MPNRSYPSDIPAQFRSELMKLLEELRKPRSFVVPMMQNDPPETDPTNLWMRWDGRLRGRYWNGSAYAYVDYPARADITSPPAVPASPAAPAVGPGPKTYRTTWTALWSQTYQGSGAKRTDDLGEKFLVYGDSNEDSYDLQSALVGFDYADIATQLTGSTITKIQLRMTNVSSYWETGVEIYFGMHNVTAEPATWPSAASLLLRKSVSAMFGKSETKTITLPLAFATALRGGTGKGLAIEAPSSDRDFYGYAAGVGSGYTAPQLIITYAK